MGDDYVKSMLSSGMVSVPLYLGSVPLCGDTCVRGSVLEAKFSAHQISPATLILNFQVSGTVNSRFLIFRSCLVSNVVLYQTECTERMDFVCSSS